MLDDPKGREDEKKERVLDGQDVLPCRSGDRERDGEEERLSRAWNEHRLGSSEAVVSSFDEGAGLEPVHGSRCRYAVSSVRHSKGIHSE